MDRSAMPAIGLLEESDLESIKYNVLVHQRRQLVDNVDPRRFLTYLRSKFVIDERDCDEIRSTRSRSASVEVFLDILATKGQQGYDEFCNAILHDQTQVFLLTSMNQTLEILKAKVLEHKQKLQKQKEAQEKYQALAQQVRQQQQHRHSHHGQEARRPHMTNGGSHPHSSSHPRPHSSPNPHLHSSPRPHPHSSPHPHTHLPPSHLHYTHHRPPSYQSRSSETELSQLQYPNIDGYPPENLVLIQEGGIPLNPVHSGGQDYPPENLVLLQGGGIPLNPVHSGGQDYPPENLVLLQGGGIPLNPVHSGGQGAAAGEVDSEQVFYSRAGSDSPCGEQQQ